MIALVLTLALLVAPAFGAAPRGFHFMEGVTRTTIPFELYKNLIVIPAQLNDSVTLHLILDTGTRSVLLFGKKFSKLKTLLPNRKIKVSGWGSADGVDAQMAHPNKLSIGEIQGNELSVAIITHRKLFSERPKIDGVIGYDLFVRFAVEINYQARTIHLYNRLRSHQTEGFTSIPLEVNHARPQVNSILHLGNQKEVTLKLLVDTGSSLGLTVFTRDKSRFRTTSGSDVIGIGLAGPVRGYDLFVQGLWLNELKVDHIPTHLIHVENHPDEEFVITGSLGASFLKDHTVIFDYPGSRLLLRKNNGSGFQKKTGEEVL
jgi:Aspartyl protease